MAQNLLIRLNYQVVMRVSLREYLADVTYYLGKINPHMQNLS
ncbi:MAG: hypothetical protein ACFCD0_14010 [Gemmataceae bacterium]